MGFPHDYLPDFYDDNIYALTPEFMEEQGIRALICDIDNTLEPYEEPCPTERLQRWIDDMTAHGIRFAFVSNNRAPRVERFNQELGFFAIPKSGKPSPEPVLAAMQALEAEPSDCAMLGDQIFTDVLAGKRAGIRAILVKPIRDKKTLFFRFKRVMEKPLLALFFVKRMFRPRKSKRKKE